MFGVNAMNSVWDDSDTYYEESSPEDSKIPLLLIFIFLISIGLLFGYMILSAIVTLIYNKISGLLGGIEVDLNELSQLKKTKLLPKTPKTPEEEESLS